MILLKIESSNIPTRTCGDDCAVNLERASLLNENFSNKSPVSNCSSHLAAGNIRRMSTSVNNLSSA